MNNRHIDIKRDIEIEKAGGFFCQACLVGKPAVEQSPDSRYCKGCFEFLKAEAEMLPATKRPSWRPKTPNQNLGVKKPIPIANDTDKVFARMNGQKIHTCKKSVEERKKGIGRPMIELPVDLIGELAAKGCGVTEIIRQLKAQGIKVSRRTVYNVLSGQRVLV